MKKNYFYDSDVGLLLALALLFPIFNRFIQSFSKNFTNTSFNYGIITYLIMILGIVYCLLKYRKKILFKFVIVYLFVILFMLISYYYFSNTRIFYLEYKGYIQRVAIIFLPISILVSEIKDYSIFIKKIRPISFIGIVLGLFVIILDLFNHWDRLTYSTYLNPFVMFLYYHWKIKKRYSDLFMILIGLTCVFLYGGRMGFFSIFIYFILYEFINSLKYSNKLLVALKINFIAILSLLLYIGYPLVIKLLSELNNLLGFNSRNFNALIEQQAFSFETRTPIFGYALYELENMGLGMHGIFGDRLVLRQHAGWIAYSHNLILEILLSFGWIIGIYLIIKLSNLFIKAFFINNNFVYKNVVLVFFCATLLRLLVSGSFVIEDNFYLMIGILLSNSFKFKRERGKT